MQGKERWRGACVCVCVCGSGEKRRSCSRSVEEEKVTMQYRAFANTNMQNADLYVHAAQLSSAQLSPASSTALVLLPSE